MPGAARRLLQLAHEVGHLLGRRDVAPEQDHAADAELAQQCPGVGRGRVALEADGEALADAADDVPQDRRFRTASFTRLPSTAFPLAASAASAAFITLPMSFADAAPVSATAFSTAAATSSSDTSAGR